MNISMVSCAYVWASSANLLFIYWGRSDNFFLCSHICWHLKHINIRKVLVPSCMVLILSVSAFWVTTLLQWNRILFKLYQWDMIAINLLIFNLSQGKTITIVLFTSYLLKCILLMVILAILGMSGHFEILLICKLKNVFFLIQPVHLDIKINNFKRGFIVIDSAYNGEHVWKRNVDNISNLFLF